MKKRLYILIVLVVLLLGGYVVYKKITNNVNVKNIVNLTTSPKEPITKLIPQGQDVKNPLNLPAGYRIGIFADLKGELPRVLTFDPNGVLVASLTKNGKVVAFPDTNKDGIADKTVDILTGLSSPHGLVFYQGKLYVGETDKVVSYSYDPESFSVSDAKTLFTLPGGGRHFTRTLEIKNNKLYTSVGSSCNVCIESSNLRAAMLTSDLDGSNLKVFASGLRNTVFFTFDDKGNLWGNDMGRDLLGDNLPPDELNVITEGGNYGWPYCYGNKVRDNAFMNGQKTDYCNNTTAPVYGYHAHVAPLGITFINSPLFDSTDQGDLLVSFHGSWNSTVPVGYKVVKLNVQNGKVVSQEDFITGWQRGDAIYGRPVDLVFDKTGYLYISDDKAGVVYVVSKE